MSTTASPTSVSSTGRVLPSGTDWLRAQRGVVRSVAALPTPTETDCTVGLRPAQLDALYSLVEQIRLHVRDLFCSSLKGTGWTLSDFLLWLNGWDEILATAMEQTPLGSEASVMEVLARQLACLAELSASPDERTKLIRLFRAGVRHHP